MTLRISLRNGEQVIVNGAVLRSAGRTELAVENAATILRGKDVMKPEDANSPARRLYFACMMAYIDGEGRAEHQEAIIAHLDGLMDVLESPEAKAVCVRFAKKVASLQFYAALSDCRWLIAYEANILNQTSVAA
jgi:flagellar protein FlbT